MRPILLTALWLVAVPAATSQTDSVISTRRGVYTTTQARRGQETFAQVCARCHQAEAFEGNLLLSWSGTRVRTLYDLVQRTMPEDRPGSLTRQQYADILAYLFELNGLPPGTRDLSPEPNELGRILIEGSRK